MFTTNIIKDNNTKEIPDLNALYKGWQEKAGSQREAITKLNMTNCESYW